MNFAAIPVVTSVQPPRATNSAAAQAYAAQQSAAAQRTEQARQQRPQKPRETGQDAAPAAGQPSLDLTA
jgi:hypothetical protein